MERTLEVPGIYEYIENKLYCTMCLSKAVSFAELKAMFGESVLYHALMKAKHTELEKEVNIFVKNGVYYHNAHEAKDDLAIYKPLYDNNGPWAKPVELFLAEVDHKMYPNVKQRYMYTLVGGLYY